MVSATKRNSGHLNGREILRTPNLGNLILGLFAGIALYVMCDQK